MKSETKIWLDYAEENLKSSKILLDNKFYNPALQNTQQSVEKALKAIVVEYGINLKRTHDILELKYLLQRKDIIVNISDDELCRISIDIAEKVFASAIDLIK